MLLPLVDEQHGVLQVSASGIYHLAILIGRTVEQDCHDAPSEELEGRFIGSDLGDDVRVDGVHEVLGQVGVPRGSSGHGEVNS